MKVLGFILLFFSCLNVFGQGVEFEASAPSVVEIGEQFRLSYSVNRKGTSLQVPALEGFDRLMGPSMGSSSSFTSINGKVTQNVAYTYTYVLEATKEGTYQIPGATITIDGKQYRSKYIVYSGDQRGVGTRLPRMSSRTKTGRHNLMQRLQLMKITYL